MIWRRLRQVPVALASTRHLSSQFLRFNPLPTKNSHKLAVYTGLPRFPDTDQYYASLPVPTKWQSFKEPAKSELFPKPANINAGDIVEVVSRDGSVEFGQVTFSSLGSLFDMKTIHGQSLTCACEDVTFVLHTTRAFSKDDLVTLVSRARLWINKARPYGDAVYAHYSLSHRCRALDWDTVLKKMSIFLGSPELTHELALGVYFLIAYEHLGFVRSRSLQATVLTSTITQDAINKVMQALTVQELERGAGELNRGVVSSSIGKHLLVLLQHYAAWSDPRIERAVGAILSRVFPQRSFEDGAGISSALQTILSSRLDTASAILGPTEDIDSLPPIHLLAGSNMTQHEAHTKQQNSSEENEDIVLVPDEAPDLRDLPPIERKSAPSDITFPQVAIGPPLAETSPLTIRLGRKPPPPPKKVDVFDDEDNEAGRPSPSEKGPFAMLVDRDLALAVSELGLVIYIPLVPIKSVLGSANALAVKGRTSCEELGPRQLFTDTSFRDELGLHAGVTQTCLAISCPINVADGYWDPSDVNVRTSDVTIVRRTTTFFDANDPMDTRAIDRLARVLNYATSSFEAPLGSSTPWPTLAGQWAAAYASRHNIALPYLAQKSARAYPDEPSAAEPEHLSELPEVHELIGTSYAPVAFPFDSALALVTQRQLVARDLLPPPLLRSGEVRPPLVSKARSLVWTAHELLSTVEQRVQRQNVLADLQDRLQQSEMFMIFRCTVRVPPISDDKPLAIVWCQELELEVEMLVLPKTKVFEGDQLLCTEILELDPLRGLFVLSM